MDAAAGVLIDELDALDLGRRPLIAGEESGAVQVAMRARQIEGTQWLRREIRPGAAQPWPGGGPFTAALIRLPKEKDVLDMLLHAVASVIPTGAPVVVFGANEEGIKSAARHMLAVADSIETVAVRRHCRVLRGLRLAVIPAPKAALAAWRKITDVDLPGGARRWLSYPGAFAKGGLDPATALLIRHLPPLPTGARVLDFAAGTGVIAAAVLQSAPDAAVDLVEIDALALAAARENVPAARQLAGHLLALEPGGRYHAILSNPPIHDGVEENHAVLLELIGAAPGLLAPGGLLQIVLQRRVDVSETLGRSFAAITCVAEDSRFRVLRGTKPVVRLRR